MSTTLTRNNPHVSTCHSPGNAVPYQRVQPVQVDRPLGRRSEPTAGHAGKIIKCVNIFSYRPNLKNTKVLTRESNWHKRKVKEAI